MQSALVGLSNAMSTVSLDQAVDSAHALLDDASATALRRIGVLDFPAGLGVLARVLDLPVPTTAELAGNLVRRSLLEVDPRGHFDMLSPIRGRARALAGPDDVAAVEAGLLGWAQDNAPAHDNYGAADAEWLGDLPAMRHAVLTACAHPETRADGYSVANRIFSSLYTSMRAREALEILEAALASGDGPPAIGAQVARRAGIAASEMRGTYEGLWLLDRADQHASSAPRPEEQLAKTASIRAEMHLDAGEMHLAEAEARRAIDLDPAGSISRQATRTLADVYASQGRFAEAARAADDAMPGRITRDERWIDLSARTVLARIALEQGRIAEAVAGARAVVLEARELAEDRVGLLAETLLRGIDATWAPTDVVRETLPWAVRLPVLAQDGRDLLARGDARQAAGLAADVVALADSARLGRDGVAARLLLGRALVELGDLDQATTTYLTALEHCRTMHLPLRAADVARRARGRRARPGPAGGACPRCHRLRAARPPDGGALGLLRRLRRRTCRTGAGGVDRRGRPVGGVCRADHRRLQPSRVRPALRARRPHRRRAAGRGAGGPRPDEPQDRRGALRVPAHGGRAPHAHLPQARHQLPRPAGRAGHGADAHPVAAVRGRVQTGHMSRTIQVTFDAHDPQTLSRFWADAMGYVNPGPPGRELEPGQDPFDAWHAFLAEVGVPESEWNSASAAEDPDGAGATAVLPAGARGQECQEPRAPRPPRRPGPPGARQRMAALEVECERLVALGAARVQRHEPSPPMTRRPHPHGRPRGQRVLSRLRWPQRAL